MNDTSMPRFLWLSADGSRFFLIEAEVVFQTGEFPLVNCQGEQIWVYESTVLGFEVDRETASAFLEKELADAAARYKKAASALDAFRLHLVPGQELPEKEAKEMDALIMALLGQAEGKEGEEVRKRIQDYLASPEAMQEFGGLSDKIDKLSAKLRAPAQLGDNLPAILASLGAELGDAPGQEEKRKREEELKKKVQESIAAALKKK